MGENAGVEMTKEVKHENTCLPLLLATEEAYSLMYQFNPANS